MPNSVSLNREIHPALPRRYLSNWEARIIGERRQIYSPDDEPKQGCIALEKHLSGNPTYRDLANGSRNRSTRPTILESIDSHMRVYGDQS